MPLGDYPLGDVPLGDDGTDNVPPDAVSQLQAMYFDPNARDFPLGDDGRYVDLHPVDAAVEIALFIEFGAIGSSADAGQTLRQIQSPIGKSVAADVSDRVRRAVAHLVERGLIRIVSIENDAPNRHTLFVRFTYVNLQTSQAVVKVVG